MIYKIIVDKQPMSNPSEERKEYEIDIAPLYFNHDVYDSLVITRDEDYVMRRLELQDYNVLVELDPPVKEPLTDINIELFDGENYIYLYDMVGNKIVAQYLVKNEFNELYVLETEMHSAIRQSANEIELIVGGQVTTLDGAVQDINAELTLKVDKNDNDQVVSMINASADEIYLRSNRLVIDSTNFKLNDQGNITATGGNIANFNINSTSFSKSISGIYDYNLFDKILVAMYLMNRITLDSSMINVLDANESGSITSADYTTISNIIDGITTNTKNVSGIFEINSNNTKNCVNIKDNYGNLVVSLGLGGINATNITGDNCVIGIAGATFNDSTYVAIDGTNGNLYATGTITQGSLKELKKNFEKLPNGLDIIKDIDIYKYNLKTEEDDTKKHIGIVIGDNFKYSKEITSKENNAIDLYSFVSVCCKAIQEQQEEIQELKARIEKLEKGDK